MTFDNLKTFDKHTALSELLTHHQISEKMTTGTMTEQSLESAKQVAELLKDLIQLEKKASKVGNKIIIDS